MSKTNYGGFVALRHGKGINQLDEIDRGIVADRMAAFDSRPGPRVGDYVRFADGVVHRFSHDHGYSLQTSTGGSFHLLASGGMNFSGSLYPGVSRDTLTDTGETAPGRAWIFHHDWWKAHNAVDIAVPVRVFDCTLTSERTLP